MKTKKLVRMLGLATGASLALSSWAGTVSEKVVQLSDIPAVAQEKLKSRVKEGAIEKIVQVPSYFVIKALVSGETCILTVGGDGNTAEGPARLRQGDNIEGPAVPWAEVPKSVQEMLTKKLPGAGVQEVVRGPWLYKATVGNGGHSAAVVVDENGKLMPLRHEPRELTEAERQRMRERELLEHPASDGVMRHGGGPPVHRESDR